LQPGEKYYAARQSYPYVLERRPGELWITTMQGGLRMKINTADIPDEAWPEAVKIVALGSSTTAPRGSVKHVYCDRLDSMLRDRGLPVEMINSGIGSSTTEHSRGRFDSDVLDHDPALVVIMLGGNDSAIDVWKNPPATKPRVAKERFADNLRCFVRTLKARNVKVILMTPPPFRWTAKLKQLYGKPPYDVNDPWASAPRWPSTATWCGPLLASRPCRWSTFSKRSAITTPSTASQSTTCSLTACTRTTRATPSSPSCSHPLSRRPARPARSQQGPRQRVDNAKTFSEYAAGWPGLG
jgi:lysophospholipase L1-like esterase